MDDCTESWCHIVHTTSEPHCGCEDLPWELRDPDLSHIEPAAVKHRRNVRWTFIASLLALALVGCAVLAGCSTVTDTKPEPKVLERCAVDDKDRAIDAEGNPSYRVYTDCGVFEVKDLWGAGFDSADRYAKIEPGKTYDLDTFGVRITFMSTFPNIVSATEVVE